MEIDPNIQQNVEPQPIEKLREAIVAESEEDKALFTQNTWRSTSKSKKELEMHQKTLLDKKVSKLQFILSMCKGSKSLSNYWSNSLYFLLLQIKLIKEISVSLLDNPNLMDAQNETRVKILKCSIEVANTDPEFILKVIHN